MPGSKTVSRYLDRKLSSRAARWSERLDALAIELRLKNSRND